MHCDFSVNSGHAFKFLPEAPGSGGITMTVQVTSSSQLILNFGLVVQSRPADLTPQICPQQALLDSVLVFSYIIYYFIILFPCSLFSLYFPMSCYQI